MTINPIDKKNEILNIVSNYDVSVKSHLDEGYNYLDNDSICIVVSNPHSQRNLEIELEMYGEFTIYFENNHQHYAGYEDCYEQLCMDIKKLLSSEICSAAIFYKKQEWLGSLFVDKLALRDSYEKTFEFVLKYKEFRDKIRKYGGIVHYRFWDAKYDSSLVIETTK